MKIFDVKNLSFSYQVDSRKVDVLKNLNFTVEQGDFIAIQGPSGSGKSTLFYILGLLLKPTQGEVLFGGIDTTEMTSDELTYTRNQKIGFVFQQFHLLPRTSALENILLPTKYPSEIVQPQKSAISKALELSKTLGLEGHTSHHSNQLSGGQQQRVAIARALINDAPLILADEPTGNLDSRTAGQTLDLLEDLNRQGRSIIIITHDPEVAKRCSKVYHLKDGAFTKIEMNRPMQPSAVPTTMVFQKIPQMPASQLYWRMAMASLPLVLDNLVRNKTKSLLTMLGVVIGVAAVLSMVTLGQFTKAKILQTYETMGVNKLVVAGYQNWELKATDQVSVEFKSFDWDKDIVPLKKVFPEVKRVSPVLTGWNNAVTSGGLSVTDKVTTYGVAPDYLQITNRAVAVGIGISPYHVANRNPVCLIGTDIAQRLFSRSNPLGQIISITSNRKGSYPCKVIGVLASQTSNVEWSPPNSQIVLPYTYYQMVAGDWWANQIHELAVQIDLNSDVEQSGKKIQAYFSQRYGKAARFRVDSDSTLVAQMKRFLNLFALLLASIALLSLLVGGIGINNMMLVSVTERLKEFGLRKALGATDRSIRVQVLLESLTLCIVAGVIGLVLGFAAYELMIFGATKFIPKLEFEWTFDAIGILLSFISIVVVGIASGLVPALRAEKLQVIEALRSE